MSREAVQHDLEQIEQVESGIAQLLSCDVTATVDKSTIENGYAILDATEGEMTGTLHEKCAAIVATLKEKHGIDAGYSIMDGIVCFAPVQPAGASSHCVVTEE
jgi:hypothetical protein